MSCIVKVSAKYRPLSGEFIGYRILVAEKNMAGRKMYKNKKLDEWRATKTPTPSFRTPYLLCTSSDYAEFPTPAEIQKFCKTRLEWMGIKEWEVIDL